MANIVSQNDDLCSVLLTMKYFANIDLKSLILRKANIISHIRMSPMQISVTL